VTGSSAVEGTETDLEAAITAADATSIGAGEIPRRVEGASRGFSGVLSTKVVVLLQLGVRGAG
jgi:hypothetical protein